MTALLADADRMTAARFLAFVDERPDEECWELIDGLAVMQSSPKLVHQMIAANLARLINEALDEHDPRLMALPQSMVDLAPAAADNMYVPDVLVIDTIGIEAAQNFTDQCLLAAEIVSPSDRRRVGPGLGRKIEVKTERYRALPSCQAVLIVEQDAMEAVLHLRSARGWTSRRLEGPGEQLHVPVVGLTCRLGDLYARTPLLRPTP